MWIDRPDEARGASQEQSSHASETSVSLGDFDFVMYNNRGIPELHSATEGLLAGIKEFARVSTADIPYSLPYDR